MGMFDWVTDNGKLFEMDCPVCGVKMDNGFQSKELDCVGNEIDWKSFTRFYNSCQACKAWIDCYVEIDHSTFKVYAVPNSYEERRKLIREEPWDLQGRTLEDWAEIIRSKGAEGVQDVLTAQLVSLGRIPRDE